MAIPFHPTSPELFRRMTSHALFRQMFAHQGLDLTKGWWRGSEGMVFRALSRCLACRQTEGCRVWLAEGHPRGVYPNFCENASAIEACRSLDTTDKANEEQVRVSLRGKYSMFYHVLRADLEPDVTLFATRHCNAGDHLVCRQGDGTILVGFRDEDKAMLFLNLFDGEIERSFHVPKRDKLA